jgi:hypothetical protein
MVLYNSWHALIKDQQVTAAMLPLYETFFPVDDEGRHAATIRSNLTAEEYLAILLRPPSGNIKLLHHSKLDAVPPLRLGDIEPTVRNHGPRERSRCPRCSTRRRPLSDHHRPGDPQFRCTFPSSIRCRSEALPPANDEDEAAFTLHPFWQAP